jgi:hypothetical protein
MQVSARAGITIALKSIKHFSQMVNAIKNLQLQCLAVVSKSMVAGCMFPSSV